MDRPAGQMGLFGQPLDVLPTLKSEMQKALRACGLSREQVVDRVNELLAGEGMSLRITGPTLEKWVALSASHQIPLRVLPFFCRAVGSTRPVEVLAAALGLVMAGPRELELMRLGEAQMEAARASRKRRRAIEKLEELR